MPLYTYKCKKCSSITSVRHSISETLDVCECGESGSMVKLLSRIRIENEQEFSQEKDGKPGDIVKQSIEEFKEDLKTEKKKLTTQEYKP